MAGGTQRILEQVLRRMVGHPDAVEVRESGRGPRRLLEVRVAPADMGAVIGRGGRTAAALRKLLAVRSESQGEHYELKILEPRER
jgi:uncharacterized protein